MAFRAVRASGDASSTTQTQVERAATTFRQSYASRGSEATCVAIRVP